MYNLWTKTEKLDIYGTKKSKKISYGTNGESEFTKIYNTVLFKLSSNDKTVYVDFFPQSMVKLSYVILALMKGKTDEAKQTYKNANSDTSNEIIFRQLDDKPGYFLIQLSNGVDTTYIETEKIDLYILQEFIHNLGLKLMSDFVVDYTNNNNNTKSVKNTEIVQEILFNDGNDLDDDIPF